MKRLLLIAALVSVLAIVAVAYAQGPGMMGGGQEGWNYCPNCGQYIGPRGGYGMGPHMMGPGMGGYGMMGRNYGHGYGMGPGMMGPGYYGQSPECQKFLDETATLRKELHNKRFEYIEAFRNPKTTPEATANLEKEVRELQEKIHKKAPQGCW